MWHASRDGPALGTGPSALPVARPYASALTCHDGRSRARTDRPERARTRAGSTVTVPTLRF
jgi:hypothetical protein